jgi:pyruvate dehydrogenase E1 component
MFGFQRIGDLIWAAGDIRTRGFLVGATAGRTTLAGEGLQHQDGHSHILALANPSVKAYDPAYGYEIAVIVREGLRRILSEKQDIVYYLTVMNEFYPMPPMPDGVEEGILKGIYKFRPSENRKAKIKAHLLASGTIVNEAAAAQALLEEEFGIASDVWSVTSFKNLYWDGLAAERQSLRNPHQQPQLSYLQQQLSAEKGVFVAATDYLKALPAMVAKWIPGETVLLGTDGYGRSDTRAALRDFFEVDARHIAYAALAALAGEKRVSLSEVEKAAKKLDIDPDKANPLFA